MPFFTFAPPRRVAAPKPQPEKQEHSSSKPHQEKQEHTYNGQSSKRPGHLPHMKQQRRIARTSLPQKVTEASLADWNGLAVDVRKHGELWHIAGVYKRNKHWVRRRRNKLKRFDKVLGHPWVNCALDTIKVTREELINGVALCVCLDPRSPKQKILSLWIVNEKDPGDAAVLAPAELFKTSCVKQGKHHTVGGETFGIMLRPEYRYDELERAFGTYVLKPRLVKYSDQEWKELEARMASAACEQFGRCAESYVEARAPGLLQSSTASLCKSLEDLDLNAFGSDSFVDRNRFYLRFFFGVMVAKSMHARRHHDDDKAATLLHFVRQLSENEDNKLFHFRFEGFTHGAIDLPCIPGLLIYYVATQIEHRQITSEMSRDTPFWNCGSYINKHLVQNIRAAQKRMESRHARQHSKRAKTSRGARTSGSASELVASGLRRSKRLIERADHSLP